MQEEKVAFGGGCFWCTEAVFLEISGVVSVTPGYAGGKKEDATYERVSTGTTGHVEVVLIEYKKEEISFGELLEVFFSVHDPTQLNRQGADIGTQYRSIIFYTTKEQEEQALAEIEKRTKENTHSDPLVSAVEELKAFYPAEAYHREYYKNHPDERYSQAIIAPKVEKVRRVHSELLRSDRLK